MSFVKFLFFIVLCVIIFFAGPYVLLIATGTVCKIIGGWGLPVMFVVTCWFLWAFVNMSFKL